MNINITNSKETSETEDYSEFEKYIIKNNVHLTKENKELRLQITELEKQNSEHESENDKISADFKKTTYLLVNNQCPTGFLLHLIGTCVIIIF